MRVVERAEDLIDAVAGGPGGRPPLPSGTPPSSLERYVTEGRHIEVQVFGDTHGTVVHLLERECSIQRRHQKVVEEAPAAFLSENHPRRTARRRGRGGPAINYVGAGTVEFLVDGDDYFFLRDEHPAAGRAPGHRRGTRTRPRGLAARGRRRASLPTVDVVASGHAIEVRLYAEDPPTATCPVPAPSPSSNSLIHGCGSESG